MKDNLTIYLCGAMEAYHGTNKASAWREVTEEYFNKYCEDIRCINPVSYYSYSNNISKDSTEIFRFDLHKVKQSDLILVNLNDIRKSIGSCMEIYEAYRSEIPIVGFLEKEIPLEEMINEVHPWVYECISRIETGEDSHMKAMQYIKEFY